MKDDNMSAPHPRFPDNTPSLKRVLAAFAPPPEALHINGHPRNLDQPGEEVMPPVSRSDCDSSRHDTSPESATRGDRSCTCHPDDSPPVPCAQKYAFSECVAADRLGHIASLIRSLTYGEMMELCDELWACRGDGLEEQGLPKAFHRWAVT